MKVAIDLTSLDDNFSGIERYTLCITKELIKDTSVDFLLIFKNKVKYFEQGELAVPNVKTAILKGNRIKILLFSLPKFINAICPDIALFFAFPPSFLTPLKKNIKVYVTIHDMVAFDVPKTMKFKSRLFFKFGYKYAAKRATKIFTVSNFSKARICHFLRRNANDVFVTYNGCDIELNTQSVDLSIVASLPNRYILCLSTIEPRKNFRWLIEQLDSIWQKDNGIPDLVIVGRKGWKTEKLLNKIGPETLKRLHFLGFVDDKSLPYVYSHSYCFIFSSIYEGFGIPIIEASLLDCLPLCSDIPTSIEILGDDYPYIFKLNDKDDFYAKLKATLSLDNGRKRKTLQRLKNNFEVFNWKSSAKQVLNVIKQS